MNCRVARPLRVAGPASAAALAPRFGMRSSGADPATRSGASWAAWRQAARAAIRATAAPTRSRASAPNNLLAASSGRRIRRAGPRLARRKPRRRDLRARARWVPWALPSGRSTGAGGPWPAWGPSGSIPIVTRSPRRRKLNPGTSACPPRAPTARSASAREPTRHLRPARRVAEDHKIGKQTDLAVSIWEHGVHRPPATRSSRLSCEGRRPSGLACPL